MLMYVLYTLRFGFLARFHLELKSSFPDGHYLITHAA